MGYYSEWILYGKHGNGAYFSDEQATPLLNKLNEIAYGWYSPEVDNEYFCSFSTVYRNDYEEVIDAVEEFSKTIPDAVFCLQYCNDDTRIHRRIYFNNGSHEEVDGRVVYDLPNTIPYYDVP